MRVNLSGKAMWIAVAVSVAGVAAYLVLFFGPRQEEIAEIRRQAEERTRFAFHAAGAASAAAQTTEEINETKRFLHAWRAEAPREENVISLFQEISQAAQAAQTRNLRIEPAAVQKLAAVWRMPVKVAVEGHFAELFEFVRSVERLSTAVWVTDLEIAPAERDSQSLRMNMTLTIFGPRPDFSGQAGLAD